MPSARRWRPIILTTAATLMFVGTALGQSAWVAPDSEKEKKNPLPDDRQTIQQGEKVAKTNCAVCHGARGKGDGPAAVVHNPRPGDWNSARVQGQTDGELFWKISNGRGRPPSDFHVARFSFKRLPENDRWAVIRFIRSLKK
jgi:mono/diheme cytochrome c family protein